ncbi:MAG: hypothetical protein ABIQ31_06630 [Ferruginibacter sp.]
MPGDIYITASSLINQQGIFKNERAVFKNNNTSLPEFLIAAYRDSGISYPKFYKMDNLAKLGWLAAEVLLKDSFETGKYQPEDVGIIFSNNNSSLDADLKYFESTKTIASPALFVYTLPNIVIGEICIKHKFKGENAFFIFDAFDAGFIEKYVTNLINSNILQACICGWVESVGEEYLAALFLVEKIAVAPTGPVATDSAAMVFTKENLNKIYYLRDG